MFQASDVLFLHAETSVHLGSGQSLGAIDLTIQRERYTHFPVGAASGIKGALRDWFERKAGRTDARVLATFGPDHANDASAYAGAAAFTDARLLLFPVRALQGVFAWVTCPLVLARLRRDLAIADHTPAWPDFTPAIGEVLGSAGNVHVLDAQVVLDEFTFSFTEHPQVTEVAQWIARRAWPHTAAYTYWRNRLPTSLLILHNDDFADFAQHATEVQARVKLNEHKTTDGDGNLFYQENLPPDALLYALTLTHKAYRTSSSNDSTNEEPLSAKDLLTFLHTLHGHHFQLGGDESIGRGIMSACFMKASTGQE